MTEVDESMKFRKPYAWGEAAPENGKKEEDGELSYAIQIMEKSGGFPKGNYEEVIRKYNLVLDVKPGDMPPSFDGQVYTDLMDLDGTCLYLGQRVECKSSLGLLKDLGVKDVSKAADLLNDLREKRLI